MLGAHLEGDALLAKTKGDIPYRRGAGIDHATQETPALELEHPTSQEGVGGDGVGRHLGSIYQEHSVSLTGKKHRGGRAGDPGAHHDCVIFAAHAPATSTLTLVPLVSMSYTAERAMERSTTARRSSSDASPSMVTSISIDW